MTDRTTRTLDLMRVVSLVERYRKDRINQKDYINHMNQIPPHCCGMVPGTFSIPFGSCLVHRQRLRFGGGGPFSRCNSVGSPTKEVKRCMEQFWWSTTMPTFEKLPA